jgi:F0F1-type ATP synthase membrane subunit a
VAALVSNRTTIRNLLIAGFWFTSLFLYVSAAAPLASVTATISKELGMASALFIALGCVMFRTRLMRSVISGAQSMPQDRVGNFFRILFWLSLSVMVIILIGYVSQSNHGVQHISRNFLIAPFGFLFFCIGRWCLYKSSKGKVM